MSKKPQKRPEPRLPFWQRLEHRWYVIAGIVAVIGWLLLNVNTVLSNVRNVPSEFRKTSYQFASWYYDDSGWSGYWTSNPQAYVDAADMDLSRTPVALYLEVKNGAVDGMISNESVCHSIPIFDFLLVRGHVDGIGNSATVVVWDTFEGHDQDFALLKLKRDGVLMSIEPKQGFVKLFPPARIALDPTAKDWPAEFCEGKRAATMRVIEQVVREQQQLKKHKR